MSKEVKVNLWPLTMVSYFDHFKHLLESHWTSCNQNFIQTLQNLGKWKHVQTIQVSDHIWAWGLSWWCNQNFWTNFHVHNPRRLYMNLSPIPGGSVWISLQSLEAIWIWPQFLKALYEMWFQLAQWLCSKTRRLSKLFSIYGHGRHTCHVTWIVWWCHCQLQQVRRGSSIPLASATAW